MALPRKLKDLNLFNEGESYMGRIEEITLPKITRKFETYRGGGMNGGVKIDMGLEDDALSAELTFGGLEAQLYKQWGITQIDGVMLRLNCAYQRQDTKEYTAVEVVLRGRFSEIDSGNGKAGENTQVKAPFNVTYYKLIWDGETLIEIDLLNMIEKVDGVDRLEEQRAALGL
ncbi:MULTISPECIES: phage major tail tube protein [Providencia]|uniref:Phage major tail tube protein n=1 Tax=Providencia rettgeri TaxID=587 RepID=A0AB35L7H8_PRORE|nr:MULTISPECIES: phage major tail tube protein [Providencia]MDH2304070.1 phage major tail tube protein [Providencia rettgeri]